MIDLEKEASQATQMLAGKTIAFIRRHKFTEVLIEFTDGSRLFVDSSENGVELSITGSLT